MSCKSVPNMSVYKDYTTWATHGSNNQNVQLSFRINLWSSQEGKQYFRNYTLFGLFSRNAGCMVFPSILSKSLKLPRRGRFPTFLLDDSLCPTITLSWCNYRSTTWQQDSKASCFSHQQFSLKMCLKYRTGRPQSFNRRPWGSESGRGSVSLVKCQCLNNSEEPQLLLLFLLTLVHPDTTKDSSVTIFS